MVSNVPCNCDLFRGAQKVTCRYYPAPLYIKATCPYLKVLYRLGLVRGLSSAKQKELLIMTIFNTRFGIVLKVKKLFKDNIFPKIVLPSPLRPLEAALCQLSPKREGLVPSPYSGCPGERLLPK